MSNVLKKVSISSLMFMTVVLNFGALVPKVSAAYMTGDLLKGPNSDAVYYVNGTTKHVFPDRKTYMTWYTNFDKVKIVTVVDLDVFTDGNPVPYRPGTKLVKSPDSARVYAVETGGVLRLVPTEAVALSLYGSTWAKWVNDLHPLTISRYTYGSDISTMYPAGTLLQKTGDTTIYYYDGTNIRPFANSAAFDANTFNSNYIVKVASLGTWTVGSSITSAEGFATISGTVSSTPTGPSGTLMVALSPNTPPANQVLLGASARFPMTTVRLTAGSTAVTVDSLTIERKGIASDAAFSDLDLLRGDTGEPLNNTSKSLNATHQAIFNDDFTIPANTSWDVVVAANMAASLAAYAGEYPAIAVVAMTLKNNSTLSGTLPITGNVMITNGTITAGTARVAIGSNNPSVSTKEVGTKDFVVSSIKINNNSTQNSQTMTLRGITWTQNGSASATDVENVKLRNTNTGTILGTIAAPTTKRITFSGLNQDIAKGDTLNLDLVLDIKGGSARTISFDIDQKADINLYDQLRNVNVLPSYFSDASYATAVSASPYYNPADTAIGNGKLRIEKVAVETTSISENKTGVLLGKFKFVMEGEIGNITSMGFKIVTSTTAAPASQEDLTNIVMKNAAGTVVAGPKDPVANAGNNGMTATTTDTVTVPVGETVYSVYGDLNSDWAANQTIRIDMFPGAITMKGDNTGNSITPTPSGVTGTTLTIKSADINVSVASNPAAQTVVAGAQDFEFANIVLDGADSGSDIRVTSFLVPVAATGNAFPDLVSGLQLFVGSTEIPIASRSTSCSGASCSTAGTSGTTTLTITAGNLTVPANGTKTVRIIGDIGTGATSGTLSVGMNGTTNCSAGCGLVAIDSQAQTFNPDITGSVGQAMTMASGGTLNLAVLQDPRAALVVGGTTVDAGAFNLEAKSETINLNSFGFSIQAPDGGRVGGEQEVNMLELWQGSSKLGEVTVTGSRATVTLTAIQLPINTTKSFTVKSKWEGLTSDASPARSGAGLAFRLEYVDARGAASGNQIANSNSADFKTFSVFRNIPSVTLPSAPSNKITGNGSIFDLHTFGVSASSNGDREVGLAKFTYVITTTTVSFNNTFGGFELWQGSSAGDKNTKIAETGDMMRIFIEGIGILVETRFDLDSNDTVQTDMGDTVLVGFGSTKYFTLRGTVNTGHDGTASNESISTSLLGDAAFQGTSAATFGAIDRTLKNDDFLWSDLNFTNYATGSATQVAGWWSGYRVSGLDNTTSTSQTITD